MTPLASTPRWSICMPLAGRVRRQRRCMLGCSIGDDDACSRGRGVAGSPAATRPRASLKEAPHGEVVRFGAAAGENHLVGVPAGGAGAEEFADSLAGLFQARRARRPNSCWLAGIQIGLGVAGRIASTTSGSMGVVAL